MAISICAIGASACGDPAVYSRAPAMLDGTGGQLDPGLGGSGGGAGRGTGGQVAVGGSPGQGGDIGATGGATGPAGSGGSSGTAGRSAAGGANPGSSGGTTGSGGVLGTGGMAAPGGHGGSGGSGGAPATGTGGGGAGGGGGKVGSGGTVGSGGGSGASGGAAGSGGSVTSSGGAGGAGGAPSDPAQLSFETSTQNWFVAAGNFTNLRRSTARHFAGAAALEATLQYTAGSAGVTNTLAVGNLGSTTPPGPGSVITFHVYLPASAPAIDWIQPFLQDSSLAYFGAYTVRQSLTFGDWNTIELTVPSTAKPTLHLIGVEVHTSGSTSLSDDVFIDSVDW